MGVNDCLSGRAEFSYFGNGKQLWVSLYDSKYFVCIYDETINFFFCKPCSNIGNDLFKRTLCFTCPNNVHYNFKCGNCFRCFAKTCSCGVTFFSASC
jgi:hypothetical protein